MGPLSLFFIFIQLTLNQLKLISKSQTRVIYHPPAFSFKGGHLSVLAFLRQNIYRDVSVYLVKLDAKM